MCVCVRVHMQGGQRRAHSELCLEWHCTTAHPFVSQFLHNGTGCNVTLPLTTPPSVNTKTLSWKARGTLLSEWKRPGIHREGREGGLDPVAYVG